ncbi:hypothetical protein SKAU_G00401690 [Synaphobranchus kaupii]|uniref:Uncharacterized protein n=1 Tax=Synaphobranchus kaupii TaxID=118154 RepID=A0A9Q1IBM1_SYNKA|nr:hypothetical protein SKAU_G00401690 [Synaphobranchus kaupii]
MSSRLPPLLARLLNAMREAMVFTRSSSRLAGRPTPSIPLRETAQIPSAAGTNAQNAAESVLRPKRGSGKDRSKTECDASFHLRSLALLKPPDLHPS